VTHLLTVLVALPSIGALAVWGSPAGRARALASGVAGLTFVLAVWAYQGLWRADRVDLRQAYEGPAGMVEAALDRRGVDDPLHRSVLGDALRERERPFESVAAELQTLAGADLASATLRDMQRLYPDDAARVGAAREAAERARRRAQRLLGHYAALERELRAPRQAAHSELGRSLVHVTRAPWIPQLGVAWYLGVDGLSAALVTLTALLGLLGVLAAGGPSARPQVLAACLACEGGLLLLYVALDLVLFYAAWVLVLLPAWGLLAAGGSERRAGVAAQAVLPALAGAAALLLVCAGLAHTGGEAGPRFDMLTLTLGAADQSGMSQALIFAGVFAAAAVRLPLLPLHGWLGRVHEELPGPVAAVALGAGLPVGGYALFRLAWPLAPDVVTATSTSGLPTLPLLVAGLALISVWFGAALSLGQRDVPGLASGLGVCAAGLIVLGLASWTPQGWAGAALLLVTQALVGAAAALAREAGAADATVRPALGLALLGPVGLPGLAGFPAALLILDALTESTVLTHPFLPAGWAAFLALAGLGLQAFAVVRWLRAEPEGSASAGQPRALVALVPLVVALVALGVWPRLLLDAVGPGFAGLMGLGGG
jgi:NADH-quinone oxidoreductase subunit M